MTVDINAIAKMYGGEVKSGQALIPAIGHSKSDRGVAIKPSVDAPDGVLVHCFNGGQDDAIAEKDRLRADGFLPELGAKEEEYTPRSLSSQKTINGFWVLSDGTDLRSTDSKSEPVSEFQPATQWEYRDESGVLLYRKKRVDKPDGKKFFSFVQPDGTPGKGDAPHVLYLLPEILATDGDVYLAEGEKCADKLVHMGFSATSLKDLTKCDLAALRNRRCIILPDNDDQGEREAEKAQEALHGVALDVAIVRLPRLADKEDIADWDGTVAELQTLARRAFTDDAPVDLWATTSAPPLPIGLLPDVIERFAFENAKLVGADPAGFAMSALACCGAALPDRITAKPKQHEDWTQPARFWVLLVGDASTNKSACVSKAASRLRSLDHSMMMENNQAKIEWQEAKKDGESLPPPKEPRLALGDTTVEAAQEALKHSPDGILVVQDEMSALFARCGQQNNQAERAFWLQTFNGGMYAVNRIGRGNYIIDNLSISMVGGIQPEAIHTVVNSGDDDGLIQRFIPIILEEADDEQDVPTPPINEELADLMDALRAFPTPSGFFATSDAPYVFGEDARAVRVDLLKTLRSLAKNIKSVNTRLSSHVGKYRGIFVRLCILWHAIEQTENIKRGIPHENTISGETASKVQRLVMEYLFPHAMAFYRSTGAVTEDDQVVQAVGGWILSNDIERFTIRDLVRNVRQFKILKDDIKKERILGMMEAYGWAEPDPKKKLQKAWDVPPAVHKMYIEKANEERERRQEVKKIIAQSVDKRDKGCS